MNAEAKAEFDWWFRAAYPGVARTVFLIVHDRATAEDVAQEAFLQMLRHWEAVSGYERPDAWVRRVAIRLAVRRLKREGRRAERERLSQNPAEIDLPHPDVVQAVRSLSPMQRAAVVLHYWDDQSLAQIARTLRVSESTVKQHLFRARARLADLLGEEVADVR